MELISRFSEIFEDCIDYYKGIEDEAFNVTEEIPLKGKRYARKASYDIY